MARAVLVFLVVALPFLRAHGRALQQAGLGVGDANAQHLSWRSAVDRCRSKSMNPGRCWMSWHMVEQVIREGVPGDVIETGVASGAQSLLMYSALRHYHTDRRIFMADGWLGLPESKVEADVKDSFGKGKFFVSYDTMVAHFSSANVKVENDPHITIVKGFFNETLVKIPDGHQFSVLRLDGDMYESTMQALTALYPKLSPGGFVYVDDYDTFDACRQAVDDYRKQHGITELIYSVAEPNRIVHDGAVYWIKGWKGGYSKPPTS